MDNFFDKNEIIEIKFEFPCKVSNKVTELRKIGDAKNQFVTNVYYLDTIRFSYDKMEIYSNYDDDDEDFSPLYSSYHDECDYCQKHKENVQKNWVMGVKIYPKGVKPPSFEERTRAWKAFQ